MSYALIRQLVGETLRDIDGSLAVDKCRVCDGTGEVTGEYCATCGGTGEEITYGSTHKGVGRGPLPQLK